MEELRQLAELAKRDPAILEYVTTGQESDCVLKVHTDSTRDFFDDLDELTEEATRDFFDDLDELSQQATLAWDLTAMETNYFDKLAAEHHNPAGFLPCPFCQAMTRHTVKNLDGKHQVFCGTCDAHGPKESTEEKALEAWNKAPRK